MIEVSKTFTFDAAHSLPHLPPSHKCHNLHGHTYGLRVICRAPINPALGWGIDYADITRSVNGWILDVVDHQFLNVVVPEITTAENLAVWIFERLHGAGLPVVAIELDETATSRVTYRP